MTKSFVKSLLCTVAFLSALSSAAVSATMNYLGNWVNTTRYATGSVIVYNSGIYYSLKSTNSAPNRNYIPSSNPTWWAPVGTVGNTILNGLVNPTSAGLGQVGDYYINTASNTMFGPKTANGWPASGVSLVGPKGDAGAQGVPGTQGVPGAQGQQGIQGVKGDIGTQGPSGTANMVGKTCAAGTSLRGFDNDGNLICGLNVHSYQYISAAGITWESAAQSASSMSSSGTSCYLATITTQAEMDYVETYVIPGGTSVGNIYIGSRRTQGTTDQWYWAFGPETGVIFWSNGQAVGSNFPGWDPDHRVETVNTAPYGQINSFYRAYVSASYGLALPTLVEGGNSGYLVECSSL
jgi:hypothetical protein